MLISRVVRNSVLPCLQKHDPPVSLPFDNSPSLLPYTMHWLIPNIYTSFSVPQSVIIMLSSRINHLTQQICAAVNPHASHIMDYHPGNSSLYAQPDPSQAAPTDENFEPVAPPGYLSSPTTDSATSERSAWTSVAKTWTELANATPTRQPGELPSLSSSHLPTHCADEQASPPYGAGGLGIPTHSPQSTTIPASAPSPFPTQYYSIDNMPESSWQAIPQNTNSYALSEDSTRGTFDALQQPTLVSPMVSGFDQMQNYMQSPFSQSSPYATLASSNSSNAPSAPFDSSSASTPYCNPYAPTQSISPYTQNQSGMFIDPLDPTYPQSLGAFDNQYYSADDFTPLQKISGPPMEPPFTQTNAQNPSMSANQSSSDSAMAPNDSAEPQISEPSLSQITGRDPIFSANPTSLDSSMTQSHTRFIQQPVGDSRFGFTRFECYIVYTMIHCIVAPGRHYLSEAKIERIIQVMRDKVNDERYGLEHSAEIGDFCRLLLNHDNPPVAYVRDTVRMNQRWWKAKAISFMS